MTDNSTTKLKTIAKRWLGRCAYICYYTKNKIIKYIASVQKRTSPPLNAPNFIKTAHKRRRLIIYGLLLLLICYYGFGAIVSSHINNRLEIPVKGRFSSGQHTVATLSHVIKIQVDKEAWTPALPIIFPASTLDNLPNFQIGVKDSANFFIKQFANRNKNRHLEQAAELLSYPEDIWLFSQNKDDKLSPGSAKQYRKALAELEHFIDESKNLPSATEQDLLYLLQDIDKLLSKNISDINKHILEHNSEMIDFKADNIFYRTQGNIYTLHYLLTAVVKDYKKQILKAEQYQNITAALRLLNDAAKINPLIIKNASFSASYSANHLAYLAFYLSQTQNKLQKISHRISTDILELQTCTLNEKE